MTSNAVKNAIETQREDLVLTGRSIVLSCEKSSFARFCIDSIRKENFETNKRNILQMTKQKMGKNSDGDPLYFIEYIDDTENLDELLITPNNNCYQKQFKNSIFCVLTFNEIADFTIDNQDYKLVKIHFDPIVVQRGTFETDEELYLCEVVKIQ